MSSKHISRFLLVVVAFVVFSARGQETQLLVSIPQPPAQMETLRERCNYIVDNYWKHFNYKGAFSSVDRLDATLGEFIAVTPYASADTVFAAINSLIAGVEKTDGKNLVTLARLAEKWCATDTSEYRSEELMIPFAQAVAKSKKVKGPEKEYYRLMAQRMTNSRTGVAPADFEFTVSDGSTGRLSEITTPTVLIFFYEPDDFDSRLALTRLGSDFVVKTLSRHNMLKVVAIYPGTPTEQWYADAESMPDDWVTGAAPGIDEWFTINRKPHLYYLDEDRVITDKDFSVDAAIMYFNQFLQKK